MPDTTSPVFRGSCPRRTMPHHTSSPAWLISENISVIMANGHTEKMMIPHIQYQDKTIVFCADLIPTAGHLPLPYVMGYDTRPLLTMPEKSKFLTSAAENNYFLWLEHDAHNQIITVEMTEKGVRIKEVFRCEDVLI
mgnify:CR=1 FL=1